MPDCEPDQGSVASGPIVDCNQENKDAFGGWAEAERPVVMVVVTVVFARDAV